MGGVIAKKDDTEKSKWKRFEKECVVVNVRYCCKVLPSVDTCGAAAALEEAKLWSPTIQTGS